MWLRSTAWDCSSLPCKPLGSAWSSDPGQRASLRGLKRKTKNKTSWKPKKPNLRRHTASLQRDVLFFTGAEQESKISGGSVKRVKMEEGSGPARSLLLVLQQPLACNCIQSTAIGGRDFSSSDVRAQLCGLT